MNALVFLAFVPVGPIDAPVPSLESERARAIVAIQLAKIRLANEVKPTPKTPAVVTPGVVTEPRFTDTTPAIGARTAGISPRPVRGRGSYAATSGVATFTNVPNALPAGRTDCPTFR